MEGLRPHVGRISDSVNSQRRLGRYASIFFVKALHCYATLAVSCLTAAVIIGCTHCILLTEHAAKVAVNVMKLYAL